jgi:hypothetical protein
MISIKLNVNEEKTYIAEKIKARMVRNAIELTESFDEKDFKTADLDGLVNYVVEIFNNKFTIDDVYDGIDAENLIPELMRCIKTVMGTMQDRLSPNA